MKYSVACACLYFPVEIFLGVFWACFFVRETRFRNITLDAEIKPGSSATNPSSLIPCVRPTRLLQGPWWCLCAIIRSCYPHTLHTRTHIQGGTYYIPWYTVVAYGVVLMQYSILLQCVLHAACVPVPYIVPVVGCTDCMIS